MEKETALVAGDMIDDNDKEYVKRAKKILPILVRQVKAKSRISYTDLAEEIGMSNPRNLNYPLGRKPNGRGRSEIRIIQRT